MTKGIIFIFPGQGPSCEGLLQTPECEPLVRRAEEALGERLSGIDTEAKLRHTRAVQLCELIAGTAASQDLVRLGISPAMVCGLSIGAYPAAVASGALGFEDAVRLVSLRGNLMQHAYPSGWGMCAIEGLRLHEIERLCEGHDGVFPANHNSETQIVISGEDRAMRAVCDAALEQGASRAVRLRVSVPSHCELLSGAAEKLSKAFEKVEMKRPRAAYLSCSTGRVIWDPERIREDLALNMARMTNWHDAMSAAYERGMRVAVEMPPGAVLSKLTRGVFTEGETLALAQTTIGEAAAICRVRAAA